MEESIFGKRAVVSFAEAADSYLTLGGSPRFLRAKDGRWIGIASHFLDRKLHTIKQHDLDRSALSLHPNASPSTRNRQCYTPFIAVLNHAATNEWVVFRQWRRPRKPKGTAVLTRKQRSGTFPIEYGQAARFVGAMSPAPGMLMTALFYTGMRPIELFALEAADVNVPGRWIVVAKSKTGEPRGVPRHEFLVPLFEALVPRGGRLFRTHKGHPYPLAEDGGGQLKTAINGARRRSGIAGVSPYTARHTVSTQLVVNGVHPHIKDQILGHAADDMSRRYTHVPQAPLIAAINTLPVLDAWCALEWWQDPVAWSTKLLKWGKAVNTRSLP